jgi:hypothetical protein
LSLGLFARTSKACTISGFDFENQMIMVKIIVKILYFYTRYFASHELRIYSLGHCVLASIGFGSILGSAISNRR